MYLAKTTNEHTIEPQIITNTEMIKIYELEIYSGDILYRSINSFLEYLNEKFRRISQNPILENKSKELDSLLNTNNSSQQLAELSHQEKQTIFNIYSENCSIKTSDRCLIKNNVFHTAKYAESNNQHDCFHISYWNEKKSVKRTVK